MKIVLIRSKRRKRTVSARMKEECLEVRVPFWLPRYKAEQMARKFLKRIKKRTVKRTSDSFLKKRAAVLNKSCLGNKVKDFSIRWSTRQKSIFGVCNSSKREIRISSRIKNAPSWVVDYLIIHEMAHLIFANHGRLFWQMVRKYPKHAEAKAFLKGWAMAERVRKN